MIYKDGIDEYIFKRKQKLWEIRISILNIFIFK